MVCSSRVEYQFLSDGRHVRGGQPETSISILVSRIDRSIGARHRSIVGLSALFHQTFHLLELQADMSAVVLLVADIAYQFRRRLRSCC